MQLDIFGYIFMFFVIIICLKIYNESDVYGLKCIISDVNGEKYCVRERSKLQLAADLLAKVTEKCKKLVNYVSNKYPKNEDVKRLVKNFNPNRISETLPTSTLTAYSENKGEKMAFCLNTSNYGNQLIDINTLTFVAIHELAHSMTASIGHKPEFWKNMKFLLINAKDADLYVPIDYKKDPQQYCGLIISDNPYYDVK